MALHMFLVVLFFYCVFFCVFHVFFCCVFNFFCVQRDLWPCPACGAPAIFRPSVFFYCVIDFFLRAKRLIALSQLVVPLPFFVSCVCVYICCVLYLCMCVRVSVCEYVRECVCE
jgi:hypothetical protein